MRRFCIILFLFCLSIGDLAYGQAVRDSIKIHFRKGRAALEPSYEDNRAALKRIADSLAITYSDFIWELREIEVIGSASPEGGIELNKRLSERRANVLFDYLSRYGELPESSKNFIYLGRNWNGLLQLVRNDVNVPYREEVIELLEEVVNGIGDGEVANDNYIGRLMALRGGEPYRYMYKELFPELRTSHLILSYMRVLNLHRLAAPELQGVSVADSALDVSQIELQQVSSDFVAPYPFWMAVKTNMLYDVAMTPNLGVEFYLGSGFSLSANYQHAWWKNDNRAFYWRIYGADVVARWYFGRKAKLKPFSGHHVGIYGQALTYDFLLNGKGYMAGKEGGDIFDRALFSVGAEYGYSLPLARSWNIDFSLGAGYMWGKYYEYLPLDGCYVWQATKMRRWFGPTKAEVSLVWVINAEIAKGGRK